MIIRPLHAGFLRRVAFVVLCLAVPRVQAGSEPVDKLPDLLKRIVSKKRFKNLSWTQKPRIAASVSDAPLCISHDENPLQHPGTGVLHL
jgi:hypothetical protein